MSKLTDEQKVTIISAVKIYLEKHPDVTQVAFAKLVGFDKTFISQLVNDKLTIGKTVIGDKYFNAIASYLKMKINKAVFPHFNTANFKLIINKLNSARSKRERCGVDGKTGLGKTYACEMYKRRYPVNTFLYKCNATDNAKELVQGIAEEVGVSSIGTKGKLVKAICKHLVMMENPPILIIDEAENLNKNSVGIDVLKVLADNLEGRVALAIVGLDIRKILLDGNNRKRQGYMQTNRRFSFGWVECHEMAPEHILEICTELGITNQSALNWIYLHVKDFDSLKRVCTEAIEEAEKSGLEITAKLLNSLFLETIKYR